MAVQQILHKLTKHKKVKLNYKSLNPLIRTDFFGFYSWMLYSIGHWIKVIVITKKLDWVYTTTYTAGIAATILKPFRKFKICFHYHGSRIPQKPVNGSWLQNFNQNSKYLSVLWLHQILFSATDIIFVPSDRTISYLNRKFPSLKRKTVIILPNGVDLSSFKPASAANKLNLRKIYTIKIGQKVILFLGRLNKEKGVDKLIKTVFLLRKKGLNIFLIIAHPALSGHEEKKYKRVLINKIDKLNLQKSILWIVDEKNIPNLYQMSNVVVLLSSKENFPLIMLEALATKTLFMGTSRGAITHILSQISNDLLLRNSKPKYVSRKLEIILTLNIKKGQILRNKGYEIAQRYSWNNTVKKMIEGFQSKQYSG